MTRPISDAWFHRLKSATRDLVEMCGGVERAADKAHASKSEVSRWQVASEPSIIPLPAVLALEAECGVPFVTTVMAELGGRRLTEGEGSGARASCLLTSHAEVMRQSAEVTASMAAALTDHTVSPTEAEIIDRGCADLLRRLSDLRQSLAGVKAGPEPPGGPVRLVKA